MDAISGWISATASKCGLYVGLAFTVFVVGLLVYGHASTSVTPVEFAWETRPGLYICDTAPAWFRPGNGQFEKHLDFLKAREASYRDIQVGACDLCNLEDHGKTVQVSCKRGHVAVDILTPDRAVIGYTEEEGRCVYSSALITKKVASGSDWTTILLPSKILGPSFGDAEFGSAPADLPPDAYALVAAHEAGHCLWGLGHNLGPSLGCGVRLNSKTGSLMNPDLLNTGWNDEGLSTPSWK